MRSIELLSLLLCAILPLNSAMKQCGAPQYAAVSAGLVKIENGEVLVLVDTAERPEDIDALRVKEAADAAKEALLQKQSIREYHMAQTSLARAIARLRVKDGMEQ